MPEINKTIEKIEICHLRHYFQFTIILMRKVIGLYHSVCSIYNEESD
jgi:hypothetical protein